MRFHYTVIVECDTIENADEVMAERLNCDEDYGFAYSIDWTGDRSVGGKS